MKNEEKERIFKRMLQTIEDSSIFDGRGTYDLYVCNKCGHKMYATYKDKGNSLVCVPCEHCNNGIMFHRERLNEKPNAEIRQWVRPTLEQVLKMDGGMIGHVLTGGLILEEKLKTK